MDSCFTYHSYRASSLGDFLLVALNSDKSVRSVGAELKFIPLTVERSTSQVIQQIVSSHNRENEVMQ